jgi:AcrR family transcriptional regulator
MMRAATATRARKTALKEARRDIHRQAILDAAERVFAARGYEGAHMQEVASEAGLALATVYSVVESKEELYAAVHASRGRQLMQAAMNATAGAGSAYKALIQGVRGYASFLVAHPAYLQLHLQESQPWALQPRFRSTAQGDLWREGLALTVEMFRAAIAEGAVEQQNPTLLARLMIAGHQVYLGDWIDGGMREPSDLVVARMIGYLERTFGRPRR